MLATGQLSISGNWRGGNKFVDPKSSNASVGLSRNNLMNGDLYNTSGNGYSVNAKAGLSYNKLIDKHNINVSLNAEINESSSTLTSVHYIGFPSSTLNTINYAAEVYGRPTSNISLSRRSSAIGLINYSYNNIYLFDFSFRYDGSSVFGTEKKYAPYMAGGFGINIHHYDFMKTYSHIIDELKIRGSYGQTGNVSFPAYTAINHYQTMLDEWYVTGYGSKLMALGNPYLTGEVTETLDVGFNMKLFKSRVNLEFSYYNKTTRDLINDVTIPSSSGFTTYKENFGKSRNRGFELLLSAQVIRTQDIGLNVRGVFANNRNTMLEISESLKDYNDQVNDYYGDSDAVYDDYYSKPISKYEEGNSMTAIYAMQSLGIDPMTGQDLFIDRAGNITYTWDGADMKCVGDTEPVGRGSFGFNFRYKQFTIDATFLYEFGAQMYNHTLATQVENANIDFYNVDKRILSDRWIKPGDITPMKDIKDRNYSTKPTSRFVFDHNVLSQASLSLQYEVSEDIVKKLRLERLRFEVNCGEMLRFSTVRQERGTSYPFARSVNFTINANF